MMFLNVSVCQSSNQTSNVAVMRAHLTRIIHIRAIYLPLLLERLDNSDGFRTTAKEYNKLEIKIRALRRRHQSRPLIIVDVAAPRTQDH